MSFSAGFAKGFADTFVGRIEDRKKRIEGLVDQGIASAKAVAPRYMQAQASYKNVLEIGDMLKSNYGVTDEEFVALAQGTDISQLYTAITKENSNRVASGRIGVNKRDFINIVDMPESILPENTTREQAVAQILGLQAQALDNEDDPNSEAAGVRSGGKSLSEFLGYNPKLSAEKQLETMKIMGYDVSDLEYFQSTQGAKQKIVPGVTRTRDVLFADINYDAGTYDSTQRKFNSMLATRLAGQDISNPDIFNSSAGIPGETKQEMRDNALEGSMAMAKLELNIVNSGAGLGLIGPAARRNLLEGIFSSIDGDTAGILELQTLIQNVENGKSMDVINNIYNEKGRFTAEDYDSIINGVLSKTKTDIEDTVDKQTEAALTDDDMGLPSGPVTFDDGPNVVPVDPDQPIDPVIEKLQTAIDSETDPAVKKALENELKLLAASDETPEVGNSPREVAKRNLSRKESWREAMGSFTKEQWEDMSDEERVEAGLPERPIDMAFAGSSAFDNGLTPIDEIPEGSPIDQELKSAASFVQDNQSIILDELENQGLSGESSKEEVRSALMAFYRDNQDDPSIGGYIANAPIEDIDRITDVFMLTLENLDKQ